MDCKYLKECGSCSLFIPYSEQIEFKKELIGSKFNQFFDGVFEFFGSNDKHYRIRSEFGIWHSQDDINYTMNSTNKSKIFIDECPKVSKPIFDIMPKLLNILRNNTHLKERLFGVEFLDVNSKLLLTLLYHKKLDDDFKNVIDDLQKSLDVFVIARSKGKKISNQDISLVEKLIINNKEYKFTFSENAFVQPNKQVNQKMIQWALSCVDNADDLLELYCGHGNFTIPISFAFNKVLATEINKSSITNAIKNCELNGANNIKFVRLSADELMQAFAKEREFFRLKDVDLFDYNFTHIFVDPPRAGLEMSVINFIKNYENIIYVSCNPDTLFLNLQELCKTHTVERFAIFDQFANTHHIECGVLLKERKNV
ncbi:tRNA m5U54 methyltransferase [Campylobacter pinnipediorum subsp. pinnipediorum]|uniref:tRNA (uridine(54)-C5)-methyltransferase TrmA n=1 Tax=Campylobacter pinnipediorum TaxID=1965231 RepID=UPI0009959C34|nr:tRNA (uridine(54)-C5)-methyltransferase TrmA [Campylobacter pinnipediorum]AQW80550.1 tRNA m5U54 methyltransferase [Campylobacter pinnipediorum subsp. pinnipediorum]